MLDAPQMPLETMRDALEHIVEQGNRASQIVARIRHLARKREPQVVPQNLNEVTEAVISMLTDELRSARVDVQLNLYPDLPAVLGDRIHLEQVLMNLIRNACDALETTEPCDRKIRIESARDADGAKLTVADSGPGLGEGGEEKVFDSFYTTKAHGLGVGLAICRTLAEAQGGRLWADPDTGHGAVFHLQLAPAP